MSANLLLHVREHPHGRVIVTPVDFPNLSVDADTYEAASAAATSRLTRRLRGISGSVRTALAAPVVAELDQITLKLRRGSKGANEVQIAIGFVVAARETSKGLLFVVRAPE